MIKLKTVFILLAFFWMGCQSGPTKVFENQPQRLKTPKLTQADLSSAGAVILDARSALDFESSKVPNSINVQWTDFSQKKHPFTGLLDVDLYRAARRLAQLGIDPDTEVIVVGNVHSGNGQEGRLAWTLKYLGINSIKIDSIENYDRPVQNYAEQSLKPRPIWKPKYNEVYHIDLKDFKRKLKAFAKRESVLVDVRSEAEYLGKADDHVSKNAPDMGAINIEWKKFLKSDGSIDEGIKDIFNQLGLKTDQEIVFISNVGVRSALATFVAQELGYKKARNFAGGYTLILNP
jgi:thiosulfate/3-mercaptopyruvate sulfurtransferase